METIVLSELAQKIMAVAGAHNIQAGQTLPEQAFDLFLAQEGAGDALLELYLEGLLEEVPHEVDILTQKGLEYLCQQKIILQA
ncbi:hypothetical protein EHW66_20410 [Erwinia psidii]|uniref:hypothetical protein n=1 Tax=Erwinia psidii TaxID=69224 RepID=UPI00226B0B6D|nr:hypothetical protein [Erwinia psidii]MCX8967245.1 hypothetical protein [Erwinia psidii]